VLEIPRSAIYYKNREKKSEIRLESEIIRIFRESHNIYGTRKINEELKRQASLHLGVKLAKSCKNTICEAFILGIAPRQSPQNVIMIIIQTF
jgi:hypothetical protein